MIVVVAWYLLSLLTPATILPTPVQMVEETVTLIEQGEVWPNVWATLERTAIGFALAFLLGAVVGIAAGINWYGKGLLVPYILVFLSVSGISAAAAGTLIFRFSIWAPVFATTVIVFPYIAINVWKGTENIDNDLMLMSRSFDVSFPRLLRRMILPNIAPSIFASVRFGLAPAWKIVTISEMFASSSGIGYKIYNTYAQYQFHNAWAWGFVFLVIILAIEYLLFKPTERWVFSYRQDAEFDLLN